MLGIPVLAGSASYAVSEAFGWPEGLDKEASEARGFYGVIVAATVIGLGMTVAGIDPMKSLLIAAVVNGVIAVPLIFLVYKISKREDIMHTMKSGKLSRIVLLTTFAVMSSCAIALFASFLK